MNKENNTRSQTEIIRRETEKMKTNKIQNGQLVAEISTVTIDRGNGVRYSSEAVALGECNGRGDIERGIERVYGPIASYLDHQPDYIIVWRLSDGRQIVCVDRMA